MIEQGAVGGIPLLDFCSGCAANAEAFVASPHQFCYFQAGGFDCSLLSFLEIGADGSVNVSRLSATPHRNGGGGRFRRHHRAGEEDRLLGNFNAGAKMRLEDGRLVIDRGQDRQGRAQGRSGQLFLGARHRAGPACDRCVTERCVMRNCG